MSAAIVAYGGGGICVECRRGIALLEDGIREFISMPEHSDLWTFGVVLRSWGITGVAGELGVDREVVVAWIEQAVLPSPHRGRMMALWSQIGGRATDWGIKAHGKTGRRRRMVG